MDFSEGTSNVTYEQFKAFYDRVVGEAGILTDSFHIEKAELYLQAQEQYPPYLEKYLPISYFGSEQARDTRIEDLDLLYFENPLEIEAKRAGARFLEDNQQLVAQLKANERNPFYRRKS